MSGSKISARYALTEQEFDFCKKHLAGLPAATAYRRAFLFEVAGQTWEAVNEKGQPEGDPVDSREVSRRASTLLKQDHIQAYLAELKSPADESARRRLLEHAIFEGDRQAAQLILDDADKMGARDAYEYWAMVMCAIGTEVVIEVPERGDVVVPMKALFPQFADALPPADVVRKTIRSLEQYLERGKLQNEEVPDEEEAPA